ncbi:zinc finger CCCH domain-containing protein 18 [Drosophila ficusphila]|uniref:zinc finger CCCH domain-containing protein 18 n=1 Tax=Drosophila ficusphila TaxID=30025 RepID=UPI001C88FD37|nr:zinc finger CCCH domain-containing protein 18 [Drosophila ficusphila]
MKNTKTNSDEIKEFENAIPFKNRDSYPSGKILEEEDKDSKVPNDITLEHHQDEVLSDHGGLDLNQGIISKNTLKKQVKPLVEYDLSNISEDTTLEAHYLLGVSDHTSITSSKKNHKEFTTTSKKPLVEYEISNPLNFSRLSEDISWEQRSNVIQSNLEAGENLDKEADTTPIDNLEPEISKVATQVQTTQYIKSNSQDSIGNDKFVLQKDEVRLTQNHIRSAVKLKDGKVLGEHNDMPNNLTKLEENTDNNTVEEDEDNLLESGELSEDTTSEAQIGPIVAAEKVSDLEDGEVFCDEEDVPINLPLEEKSGMPICRYHIRKTCFYGSKCRFRHPEPSDKGNYVMFEKKVLPVATAPIPPVWPGVFEPFADGYKMPVTSNISWQPRSPLPSPHGLNDMDVDPYYVQEQPEVKERVPLLPTPTFEELLYNYQEPRPITWKRRLDSNSHSTTPQESPLSNSSIEDSPPRSYNRSRSHIRERRASPCSIRKPYAKRHHSPSPPWHCATRNRGPRTPSRSPERLVSIIRQPEPKRARFSPSSSSSSDSYDSSSYQSSTESSDEYSSSSSESDASYRKTGNTSKFSSRTPAKTTSRNIGRTSTPSSKCLETPSSSKSANRKQTDTRPSSKSSMRTPARNPPKVNPNAPRKPNKPESSYSVQKKQSRQEYLLMELLRVEKQIARKEKYLKDLKGK